MFTGLVAGQGKLARLVKTENSLDLFVSLPRWEKTLVPGDSIAVNGVCLTATQVRPDEFRALAVEETLRQTTLRDWAIGEQINLEPALRWGNALDGHWVTGHVDAAIEVMLVQEEGQSRRVSFRLPQALQAYVARKGSVALDGISLTVAEIVGSDQFNVALIPYTLTHTNAGQWRPGRKVNIEVDLIARYVERWQTSGAGLSMEKLRTAGY
jgi:riboflavin synthase